MSATNLRGSSQQRGMALITSLLLLLVMTIMAVAMFRGFGTQEKIAGNVRDKARALHAAESAQQYAEWWISNGGYANVSTCTNVITAGVNQIEVCDNALNTFVADVTQVPWKLSGVEVGVDYTPPDMAGLVNQTPGVGTYYQQPRFYISKIGSMYGGGGIVYQITAVGYGGSPTSVAVVESTYVMGVTSAF